MSQTLQLSAAFVQTDVRRDSPRPPEFHSERYVERYDWNTLFYDVYRVGEHVVLQGPPLFNFLPELRKADIFAKAMRFPFPKARHLAMSKRGEIWFKTDLDRIAFDCPLGSFDLAVQPDQHARFAGRRAIVTQSKNNQIRWIIDWARFHNRMHGADALLFYDNGSDIYDCAELQRRLDEAVPEMLIQVVPWPYVFGAQGGPDWAVNGIVPDWDSDFGQVGVLQHARFRFLPQARSVLHNDIDELVIGTGNRSVFEAAEQSPTGMVKFEGRWISVVGDGLVDTETCRHADFTLDEGADVANCPPKWCMRPQAFGRKISWGVHNVFGARCNDQITPEFLFRHFRGITTSWKYERWKTEAPDTTKLVRDNDLIAAFEATGLEPGSENTARQQGRA